MAPNRPIKVHSPDGIQMPMFSQAMTHNGLVYVSGNIGYDYKTMQPTGTGVADHTRQILSNIQTVLRAAGCSSPSGGLSNIIKATVFLTDMKDFSALNTAWVDVLTQAQRDDGLLVDKQGKQQEAVMPARTCVQVAGLPFGTDVEIECVAHLD